MSFIQVTTQNADFTMNGSSQVYLIDCTSNNVTVTFDDINNVGNGYIFTMRRMDTTSNTLTIQATNGQTIDGGSTYTLPDSNSSNNKSFLSWNTVWTSLY